MYSGVAGEMNATQGQDYRREIPSGTLRADDSKRIISASYQDMEESNPREGFLVYLDGMKGAGKGTLKQELLKYLLDRHIKAADVKESKLFPSTIYDAIQEARREPLGAGEKAILLLLSAGRGKSNKQLENLVRENQEGAVLVDRSYVTTLITQLGYSSFGACFCPVKMGERLSEVLVPMKGSYIVPDLSIILTCTPEQAYRRVIERGRDDSTGTTLYDLEKTREVIKRISPAIPNGLVIDTTSPEDETPEMIKLRVLKEASEALNLLLKKRETYLASTK